jgi:hypothetical protein
VPQLLGSQRVRERPHASCNNRIADTGGCRSGPIVYPLGWQLHRLPGLLQHSGVTPRRSDLPFVLGEKLPRQKLRGAHGCGYSGDGGGAAAAH